MTPGQRIGNSDRRYLHKTLGDFQLYPARSLTSLTHHHHLLPPPPPFTETFYTLVPLRLTFFELTVPMPF
jgi:hypothetical protein